MLHSMLRWGRISASYAGGNFSHRRMTTMASPASPQHCRMETSLAAFDSWISCSHGFFQISTCIKALALAVKPSRYQAFLVREVSSADVGSFSPNSQSVDSNAFSQSQWEHIEPEIYMVLPFNGNGHHPTALLMDMSHYGQKRRDSWAALRT